MPDFTLGDILSAYGSGVPDPENPSSGQITPATVLAAFNRAGRGVAQADVALTQGIKNALMAPGDVAAGRFATTPATAGILSDEDVARAQLNEAEANRRAFDLASIAVGTPGGGGGAGSGVRAPLSFSERMAEAQDIAFQRAQKGTATGDYGLGTARRTAPDAPRGSFDDLATRERAGFQGDKERILDEYRQSVGLPRIGTEQPLLAPGETAEDIGSYLFSGGNKQIGAALAPRIIEHEGRRYQITEVPYGTGSDVHTTVQRIKKDGSLSDPMHPGTAETHAVLQKDKAPTTEMTPIGEQYVLPGAEQRTPAQMAQRAAEAPLRPEVPQKPPGGMFDPEGGQGTLFSGGNARAAALLALSHGAEDVAGPITGVGRPYRPGLPSYPAENYDFLTGTRPNAPFPQYADVYPPTGPPTMKPAEAGATYPAKTLTPEGQAVAKARQKIMQEMEGEGYRPFFDPSQRFPADFASQPGPHVDTAMAVAAKPETIARHLETIGAPETVAALRNAVLRGLDLRDSQGWYLMGQLEKFMIDHMGAEAGRKQFRDQFATAMSATTSGMTPEANLIMSQYLNYLKKTGQPFPTESFQTPVAVGSPRTMPNVEAYQRIFSDPRGPYEALGLENPKRTDFAQAQMGNPNAFTIDEQMAHGMVQKDVPQKGTYGLLTNVGRQAATAADIAPQEYQGIGWAGFKKMLEDEARAKKGLPPYGPGEGYQGQPEISVVNDMIERIHRLTGRPRLEVAKKVFIENNIPVYGLGALTLGGLLEAQKQTAP